LSIGAKKNNNNNSLLKEIGKKISLNTGESRKSVSYTSAIPHFGVSAALQCHSIARFFVNHW